DPRGQYGAALGKSGHHAGDDGRRGGRRTELEDRRVQLYERPVHSGDRAGPGDEGGRELLPRFRLHQRPPGPRPNGARGVGDDRAGAVEHPDLGPGEPQLQVRRRQPALAESERLHPADRRAGWGELLRRLREEQVSNHRRGSHPLRRLAGGAAGVGCHRRRRGPAPPGPGARGGRAAAAGAPGGRTGAAAGAGRAFGGGAQPGRGAGQPGTEADQAQSRRDDPGSLHRPGPRCEGRDAGSAGPCGQGAGPGDRGGPGQGRQDHPRRLEVPELGPAEGLHPGFLRRPEEL
ncbi:MAG: hypothetical protein AVDCRST_MAG88-2872, partial [uncultured Thermomicrobiales bacterium]